MDSEPAFLGNDSDRTFFGRHNLSLVMGQGRIAAAINEYLAGKK
jgi:hypothetical protein